jgi:hypothetical protein
MITGSDPGQGGTAGRSHPYDTLSKSRDFATRIPKMNEKLETILEKSLAFHEDLGQLWAACSMPDDKRSMIAVGFCSIVREHVLSQQRLLTTGFDITAMTLVRPAFESLIRAIWMLKGASDEWVDRFLTPHATGADASRETVMGPPVDSMLATIEKHHPAFVHGALKGLKDTTWSPMHSYVHGGVRPVLQALVGCPEPQQVAVVLNGNGFALLATNVMLMACEGPAGVLHRIQRHHLACLPPMTPVVGSGGATG